MYALHDRINRVINTSAFEESLSRAGVDLFEFECNWPSLSEGCFENLPPAYQEAIRSAEAALVGCTEVTLA
jgi:hypothetical protein